MSPKILTVDDSKAVRIIVKKAFKLYDCTIVEATNGAEGLEVAAKEKPDLILLDVTMPTMDGVEMLSQLKQNPALKGIPVMMLTAESGKEMVVKIAKLGVRDYIVKPFKEEALIEKVIRIIELRAKPSEARAPRAPTDPCSIVVIDDKEVIVEQVQKALASWPSWSVKGIADTEEAYEYAKNNIVDAFIVSLSLPNEAAFNFYRLLRSTVKTNSVPVLGMALKTAQAEQQQAQTLGFAGIIAKPIEPVDTAYKMARALNINLVGRSFVQENGVLRIAVPSSSDANMLQDMAAAMEKQITGAVEGGVGKALFDLRGIGELNMEVLKLVVAATRTCQALSMSYEFSGTDQTMEQAKSFDEARSWTFIEAMAQV